MKTLTTFSIFSDNSISDAVAWAKHQFYLGSSNNGKDTIRDQLNLVWKTTGAKPAELYCEHELDELFYDAWQFFLKLHSKRSSNGFGVNPLSYTEIKAFFDLHQIYPAQYELELIEQFDNVAMEIYAKNQEKQRKQQELKRKK